jgi:thiol-disulfide isomerase/thioredoxin
MKKIISIILLLSLSLFAQKMTFKTLKNEYIQIKSDNNTLNFKNLKYHNKDTLLFFFGSECPVCSSEIDKIKELSRRLPIIGIHAQADIGDNSLKKYIRQIGYRFDILSFSTDIHLINKMKEMDLRTGEVPIHILVDRDGNLKVIELSELLSTY